MKYFLGVIAIIILFNIYDSHQEKKAEKLKKTITCMDFLKTDSPNCLDSPFNFVQKKSEKEALKEIKGLKKDIENLNIKLNNFYNLKSINEDEYQIKSWSEFDKIEFLVKDTKDSEVYNKKIVAIGKLSGCMTTETFTNEKKYYFCSDSINRDDEYRTTIFIKNINNLPDLKKILDKFSELGLRSDKFFISNVDFYDLQVYGKIKKINIMSIEMEVHSIKFFQRLVSDNQILNLLENKIFWNEWNNLIDFQKSRSL